MIEIEILDLGINNLRSVTKAFSQNQKNSIRVIEKASETNSPDIYIIPGVGNFAAGMKAMKERNYISMLHSRNSNVTVVGICLGLQLLGTGSEESQGTEGLNLIDGYSEILPSSENLGIPNMGWNTVIPTDNNLFESFKSRKDFYFVHSYHFVTKSEEVKIGTINYGSKTLTIAIASEKVFGFQFHPEKSAKPGLSLISEIIEKAR